MNPEQYEHEASLKIRTIRRAADMTQADIGAALGIARERVSDLERGRRVFTLALLCQLADAFGVDPLDLLADLTKH